MIECTNVEMQDQLPDLIAGALSPDARALAEAHRALCAACQAEYELLQMVRRMRPAPARVNIAAIVAALPAAGAQDSATRSDTRPFRVITGGQAQSAPSLKRPARTARPRPVFGAAFMRYAAAVTLVAIGGLSLIMADRTPSLVSAEQQVANSILSGTPFDVAMMPESAMPYDPNTVPVQPVVSVAPAVLPIQELSAYSDEELTLLMEQLEAWDGATHVDSTSTVPVSGGTPFQGGS